MLKLKKPMLSTIYELIKLQLHKFTQISVKKRIMLILFC